MAKDELPTVDPAQSANLTDWKNEPNVTDLKSDYDSASSAHSAQMSKITAWLDNLNVTGPAKPKKLPGRSSVQPMLIRKQAEWRYSALTEPFLSTDELFSVSPVTWEDRQAAIQNQLVLNYQFNIKIDKVRFIDDYVRTAVNEGTVIVRVGWREQTQKIKETVPVYAYYPAQTPDQVAAIQEALQLKLENPNAYHNLPDDIIASVDYSYENRGAYVAKQEGTQEVEYDKIIVNQPTAEVVNSQNVVIDPTCNGDIKQAQFVIYSFETSKSDLEKDGRYKNLDKISASMSNPLNTPDHMTEDQSGFNFKDEPRKKFIAYEYWGYWDINGDGKTVPIVATFVGNTMIRLEENPFPDKQIPFVIVPYLPVTRSIYGEPDGALLEDNQKIIGATTRAMIDILARSANGQTGIRKDMLDVTNRRKFDKGEDYEFNANVDPRQGVYMHTSPEIPQSAPLMIQYQNNEAESLTGVKSFSQGIASQALGDVAAGIRGALDAASKRELGILRRLAQGIVDIGYKFVSMNAEFLSEEEVVRITNDDFVSVRRDELAGNFDLKLSISTAEADNQKAQELAFMLQTMGNSLPFEMSQMVLSDIARLRNMPDLAKRIEKYQPQPDPLAQRKAELEIALLEAQIAETQSKAIENRASAGYKATQAGNVQSDTDLKNLDYVEQESGVKQARDVERIQAQAQSQTQTKIVDYILKTGKPLSEI
ncbi:portal protein [Klebsiella phage KpCHEMY26]|uniref:Putative portal protein n=1 Tax=Klebsiella phage KpCHEMY26 TaxID=2596966 RepID=A0A5B8R8S9_9CAUD|nr:portal protein [Klebsiella phage KpCHEMY26]QEA03300.1 putative portal protein [Klebsiella phage KpCHEMY26]